MTVYRIKAQKVVLAPPSAYAVLSLPRPQPEPFPSIVSYFATQPTLLKLTSKAFSVLFSFLSSFFFLLRSTQLLPPQTLSGTTQQPRGPGEIRFKISTVSATIFHFSALPPAGDTKADKHPGQ